MQRREWVIASLSTLSLAGCLGDEEANDGEGNPEARTYDTGTNQEPEESREEEETRPDVDMTGVPESAIHYWPFIERTDSIVYDLVSDADGEAIGNLENVRGEWREGYAEYAGPESGGHIDLGYRDSIGDIAISGSMTILASVMPEEFPDEQAMTILGAGGGESSKMEFRLGHVNGTYAGQPLLFVVDDFGNEISAVSAEEVEEGEASRIVGRLDGDSAEDMSIWIDGEKVDMMVMEDDGLSSDTLVPNQSFGIFASNPQDQGSIGTRQFFNGVIDDVIVCDEAIPDEDVEAHFEYYQ